MITKQLEKKVSYDELYKMFGGNTDDLIRLRDLLLPEIKSRDEEISELEEVEEELMKIVLEKSKLMDELQTKVGNLEMIIEMDTMTYKRDIEILKVENKSNSKISFEIGKSVAAKEKIEQANKELYDALNVCYRSLC